MFRRRTPRLFTGHGHIRRTLHIPTIPRDTEWQQLHSGSWQGFGPGGETLGRLEVGKASGQETFVRGSASPRIAAVPTFGLSSIPKGPEDLAEPKAGGDQGYPDAGPRQGG